ADKTSGRIALDLGAKRGVAGFAIVNDALYPEGAHGIADFHRVPVAGQTQAFGPGRLVDQTGHNGVGRFRLQVRVSTGYGGDLEAGAVEARIVDRAAGTLLVETFRERCLAHVA